MNIDKQGRGLCTTSGESVEEVRAKQTNETGQHEAYIVLCEEERQKGFVRPYRDAYQHVGLQVCGKRIWQDRPWNQEHPVVYVCALTPEHDGPCGAVGRDVANEALAEAIATHHFVARGCGTVTTMGRALSETYARDPTFYGSTFCVGCNKHLPVAEFVWTKDGQRVGS